MLRREQRNGFEGKVNAFQWAFAERDCSYFQDRPTGFLFLISLRHITRQTAAGRGLLSPAAPAPVVQSHRIALNTN